MTARSLICEGPLPPLTAGCRVANELLARLGASGPRTWLMGAKEAAQLLGVGEVVLMLWYARVFGKGRTQIDLRDLWGVLRWAQLSQLGCFDLWNVAPKVVDGVAHYDLLEVLNVNGWPIPNLLASLRSR